MSYKKVVTFNLSGSPDILLDAEELLDKCGKVKGTVCLDFSGTVIEATFRLN